MDQINPKKNKERNQQIPVAFVFQPVISSPYANQ